MRTVAIVLGCIGAAVAFPKHAEAQHAAGRLSGTVSDSLGQQLAGARVQVPALSLLTSTGRDGRFELPSLPAGDYRLVVAYIGFLPDTEAVTVRAGQPAALAVVLHPRPTVLPSITVSTARPRGDAMALNQQRTSDQIVNVVPAEVITSLPNTNVADATGRLPGVTLERDEGEGKYIQVRGTEPRLSNLTIDGVHVPSPEGGVRNVKLDVIPAEILGQIELNKTLTPDMDADAIGGSVNLVTRTPGPRPFVSFGGLGGYTDLQHGRTLTQFSGSAGTRLGPDNRLGLIVGGTYDWNGRGIDDVEPSATDLGSCGGSGLATVFCGADYRRYQYQRGRIGGAGGLDYRLANGGSLYLRALYSDFRNYGFRWVNAAEPGSFLTATTTNPDGTSSAQVQNRRPHERIYSVVAGAEHALGSLRVDYSVSASRAWQTVADQRTTEFVNTFDDIAYSVSSPDGITPRFEVSNGRPVNDPTTYVLDNSELLNSHTAERSLAAALNLSMPLVGGEHPLALKVGGKVRDGRKDREVTDQFFDGTDTFTMDHVLATFNSAGFYKGQYPLGPVPDEQRVNSWIAANPGELTLNVDKTHDRSDPNNYVAKERIYAGYAMSTLDFQRVHLVGGVRVEGTRSDYTGNRVAFDTSGAYQSTVPIAGTADYTDVLPSLTVRLQADPNTDLRIGYGMAIARPVISDLVPFVTQNDKDQQIAVGNPDLKPTRSNNFDLLGEHYFTSVGVASAGFFYKDMTDPIFPDAESLITSGPNAGFTQIQTINGPKAHVYGIELAWQQQLIFLPGAWSGLGVLVNYTHTESKATVPGRTDHPGLPRQAPNLWNVGVTYDRARLSARLGVTHNGASIFEYNFHDLAPDGSIDETLSPGGPTGPNGDVYLYSRTQVDAQVSYRLPNGVEVYANGLNLNNAVFGFYNGNPRNTIQREFYGPSTSLGVRVNR
ncbi:MAG: TonB-dependent receptor [Gemmatimonadales bacterium]